MEIMALPVVIVLMPMILAFIASPLFAGFVLIDKLKNPPEWIGLAVFFFPMAWYGLVAFILTHSGLEPGSAAFVGLGLMIAPNVLSTWYCWDDLKICWPLNWLD